MKTCSRGHEYDPTRYRSSGCPRCNADRTQAWRIRSGYASPIRDRRLSPGPEREDYLERQRDAARDHLLRQKQRCIDAYGGRCACCSENRLVFLVMDHVDGGGNAWRRANVRGSMPTYRWLIKHGFPEGWRVLCHNCNYAESQPGGCPHRQGVMLHDSSESA